MQGLLLDAASDLIERLAGELDDVEGVEHGDGVEQLVADRVGIATERVQGGMLDGDLHVHAVFGEPVGVDLPRTALDRIQQPGLQAAVLVACQVDHHGHGLVGAGDLRGPPDVLVHADGLDALEPVGLGDPGLRVGLDCRLAGVPRDAEMPGDRGHGGVVAPQRVDRPRRRPGGELGAGRGVGLDLGPGPTSTRRFGTPPDPLAPSHPHRPCGSGASCSSWTRRPWPIATTPQSDSQ